MCIRDRWRGVLLSMCRGLLRIRKHTMCFFRLIRRSMQPSLSKGFQLICTRGSYRMTASLCPVAVSYTHLDVYKRQGQGRPGHVQCRHLVRGAAQLSQVRQATQPVQRFQIVIGAVQIGDVYKRQSRSFCICFIFSRSEISGRFPAGILSVGTNFHE